MKQDWQELFSKIESKKYYKDLVRFWNKVYGKKKKVYPPREILFHAFDITSPKSIKVVILGQDPYHEEGQAMGLSFSVPSGVTPPPSLRNIYKEIEGEFEIDLDYGYGDLTGWGRQGILLLNAYLSVEEGKALSHKKKEYELLLDDILAYLEGLDQPIVYLLWGNFAKKYECKVINPNHLVITSSHPSPLAANRGGWFGEKQFIRCNEFLKEHGSEPIDWVSGRRLRDGEQLCLFDFLD